MQGTHKRFEVILNAKNLEPMRPAAWSRRDNRVYYAGVLNTLYLIRNNFQPDHYDRSPDARELEQAVLKVIRSIENRKF